MSRFAVNVALASLAIIMATCAIASFFATIMIPISPLRHHAVFGHFYQGRFRLFWIESALDPLAISLMNDGPDVRIEPYRQWPDTPHQMVGVDLPRNNWFRRIPIGGYRTISAFGGGWRTRMARPFDVYSPGNSTFVRMPAWLPCLVLLYCPVRAIIRGVRERYRKRHNLCENCGYLLHALTIPRCPECGTATELTAFDQMNKAIFRLRPKL